VDKFYNFKRKSFFNKMFLVANIFRRKIFKIKTNRALSNSEKHLIINCNFVFTNNPFNKRIKHESKSIEIGLLGRLIHLQPYLRVIYFNKANLELKYIIFN
jgi:hypothetical protein